jgi:outer membrane protein assembly factor BamD
MQKLLLNFRFLIVIILLISLGSCSNYQKILKSTDNEFKLEKAIEYYYNEDYNRAIGLLSDVVPAFRGTQRAEKVNYYFAMAHFKQRDYILASHYLRSFVSAFPTSEHAEEFLYLSAYAKYLESPRASLDQTVSREAIREFQIFINRYPNSERVEDAHAHIDELRRKLEDKVYQNAMLYYNLNDYRAAVTTFHNLINDFPDTRYREEALFFIVRSHYEFAQMSIPQRQIERYREVIVAHNQLVRHFPEGRFISQSNRMMQTASSEIERLQMSLEVTEHN